MEKIVLLIHILAAAAVIGLVLVQHGKGADMGASFGGGGGGASGSLFGVSGSSNLLSRLTALFTMVFFATSLTLAYLSSSVGDSVVKASPVTEPAPAALELGEAVDADIPADIPADAATDSPVDVPN